MVETLCLLLWFESIISKHCLWTESKQYDSQYDLYFTLNPTHLQKGAWPKVSTDLKDRWRPGGASCRWPFTRWVLFHLVPSSILFQITTSRCPHPPDRVRISCFFLVLVSRHCMLMSAKWLYSSLCLLSLLCFCTVSIGSVFSQKCFFFPHRRWTFKTQIWRWWVAI